MPLGRNTESRVSAVVVVVVVVVVLCARSDPLDEADGGAQLQPEDARQVRLAQKHQGRAVDRVLTERLQDLT